MLGRMSEVSAGTGARWLRRSGYAVALCCVVPLAAEEPPLVQAPSQVDVSVENAGFEIERFSWLGSVEPGQTVTVRNDFGDVRARFGGYQGQVEVLATLQHFSAEGPALTVETRATESGVEVTAGYRVDGTAEWLTHRRSEHKKRADVVVFVPRGAMLVASTDHGLLQVRGIQSDLKAKTVSGEIEIRKVAGDFDLATKSGSILALVGARGAGRRQSMVSASGDLTAVLSEDVNLTVRVATGGLISTDFSLRIEPGEDPRGVKTGEAVIGKGTTELVLSSESGHLRLARQPLARKARVRPREGS